MKRYSNAELISRRPTEAVREATRLPVTILLDNVRSAQNVGLVFRLADCVNATALWLSGITPYPGVSPKATKGIEKTAVGGSLLTMPWRRFATTAEALAAAREQGLAVVAYEQAEGAREWPLPDPPLPLLAVFGHEREGVADSVLASADEVVELPARGITNSLNVALCASAVLYGLLARSRA